MTAASELDAACRLRLFGGAAVECVAPPACVRAASPRQLALLALLATRQGGLCRDRLLALLWPDAPESRARHQLSDAVYFVRCAFGRDTIHVTGASLSLDPALVRSDVADFDAAVLGNRLRDAAAIWSGPFLDGFHAGCGRAFEEWQDGERMRYDSAMSEVLVRLAEETESAGDLTEASHWWGRLELHEPLSGRATEGAMRVLARSGDRSLALHRYEQYEARLRAHLDVAPERRLTDLADRIRKKLGQVVVLSLSVFQFVEEVLTEIPDVLLG